MKNMKKVIVLIVLLSGFAVSSFAQATAYAPASATIVTPISISITADMNFGNIAVGSTGGTVILTPAGSRSATGGITLPAIIGTVSAASFTVSGSQSYTYVITLPSTLDVTHGSDIMTLSTFTSTPSATGTLGSGGTQTLNVGATITVAGTQPAGTYTNTTGFPVTVNYN